jgi:rhomboid protease GluP
MNTQNQPQSVHLVIPTVKPLVTYGILGVLVMIFVYANNQPNFSIFTLHYAISNAVYDGEYYRLFTAMFMHADDTHLISNAFSLYVFGRYVESVYGHWRFALIYFLGGLAGSFIPLPRTNLISRWAHLAQSLPFL